MTERKKQLIKSVDEAEVVLLGIGREFAVDDSAFFAWELYKKWKEADREGMYLWLEPFLKSLWIKEQKGLPPQKAYKELARLLEGKNYFLVTLVTDDLIYASGLNPDRIVAPCGSINRLQCSHGCTETIYSFSEDMQEELKEAVISGRLERCRSFLCKKCKERLEPNVAMTECYNENGYLPMWEKYTLWLQHTLNRKLCVIEAGVDFSYPSVIRFPFEKVAFYNKKAAFYRIHEKWHQLTEELREKGTAVDCNSIEFFGNLFV